jgi:MFS family permease
VGMFALGTDSFVVVGVLPEISDAFGVSVGAAGQMASIYSITFALMSPPIAALAATVPRKRLLLCGGIVFALANLGTVVAPTFGLALLTRIIAGMGAATFSPTATGAAATLVRPEQRGFALSVVVAGLTISTATGVGPWDSSPRSEPRRLSGLLSSCPKCPSRRRSAWQSASSRFGQPRRLDPRDHIGRAERHLYGLHLFCGGF